MKYYSLYKLLMFFEHQVKTDFEAIKIMVQVLSDDTPDDDAKEIILSTLRACGMTEKDYEEKIQTPKKGSDVVWHMGTHEALLVIQPFEWKLQDRTYQLMICLN